MRALVDSSRVMKSRSFLPLLHYVTISNICAPCYPIMGQIRCLQSLLIEDTVHFEQKFFMKNIALGRVDIAGAHAWFRRASRIPDIPPTDGSGHAQGGLPPYSWNPGSPAWTSLLGLLRKSAPFGMMSLIASLFGSVSASEATDSDPGSMEGESHKPANL